MTGARLGVLTWPRRLVSWAVAQDLTAFIVPDQRLVRTAGLDLQAAGLRPVPTPRHATVLLILGPLPEGLEAAATVAYAQMPRPRRILTVGVSGISGLPAPDIATLPDQDSLVHGVAMLRQSLVASAFAPEEDFDLAAVRTRTEYVCPMHPAIVRDEPGNCPICGMDLIAREATGATTGERVPDSGHHDHGHDQHDHESGHARHAQPPGQARHGSDHGPEQEHESMDGHASHQALTPAHEHGHEHAHYHRYGDLHAPTEKPRTASREDAGTTYTCPMHPEVVMSDPGRCAICGMDLVAQATTGVAGADAPRLPDPAGGHDHNHRPRRVPEQSHGADRYKHEDGNEHAGVQVDPQEQAGIQVDSSAAQPGGASISYTCPMHPEFVQSSPGHCPICGMTLVPRADEATQRLSSPRGRESTNQRIYTCPMHPQIRQENPGRCPKCGMDLVQAESEPEDPASPASRKFARGNHEPEHDHHVMHAKMGTMSEATPPLGSADDPSAPENVVGSEEMARHTMSHPTPPAGQRVHDHLMPVMDHAAMDHGASAHAAMDHSTMHHPPETPTTTAHETVDETSMDHTTMDHSAGDHTTMDHSMHGGGFMSMVAMTKDLPRSADGLPMEWIEVPFGPLFPGLPGGLNLSLTLDGDGVARAGVATGVTARGLAASWTGPVATLPERLSRLEPTTPVAYRLLAQQAIEVVAGLAADGPTARARVRPAEWERVSSHLGWLSEFGGLVGDRALAQRAASLQLAATRSMQDASAELITAIRALAANAVDAPFMRSRLAGIGQIRAGEQGELRGPVARASGMEVDTRANDAVYQHLEFTPVQGADGDALTRYQVRLAEILTSLDLIDAVATDHEEDLPPTLEWAKLSGSGHAAVETPRGAAQLHLTVDNGTVVAAHVDTPSVHLIRLVPDVAVGNEVADALVAVASLDVSPWEVDQ